MYIEALIRLSLLTISVCGYLLFIGKHIRMEFTLGAFFSGLCSVMFFAGILNILAETAFAVWLGGLILAGVSIYKREFLKPLLCPGIIIFAVFTLLFLLLIHGRKIIEYDDFSHWALVTKLIYNQNRIPNFSDLTIRFQSYPTGSASLLYYFMKMSKISSEWFQIYVHALFAIGMLIGLFAFVKSWWGILFSLATTGILLLCNNGLFNLQVDTLLPISALGAMFLCYYYRDDLGKKYFWLIPHLITMVSIKNSGFLFAVYLLIYAMFTLRKKEWRPYLILCSVPAITLLLWQKHVMLTFSNGLTTKHAMSVEGITSGYLQKDAQEVMVVVRTYLEEVVSFENPAIYLGCLILLLIIAAKMQHCEKWRDIAGLAAFIGGCYGLYTMFMLGMYLTTMPYREAARLASFARYHRSILIFCGGLLYLAVTEVGKQFNRAQYKKVAIGLLSLLLFYKAMYPGLWYTAPKPLAQIRAAYEAILIENQVQPGKKYCIVMDDEHVATYDGYLKYMSKYLLDSDHVWVYGVNTYVEKQINWENYDYLVCFGKSMEMTEFLLDNFGSEEQRVYTPGYE